MLRAPAGRGDSAGEADWCQVTDGTRPNPSAGKRPRPERGHPIPLADGSREQSWPPGQAQARALVLPVPGAPPRGVLWAALGWACGMLGATPGCPSALYFPSPKPGLLSALVPHQPDHPEAPETPHGGPSPTSREDAQSIGRCGGAVLSASLHHRLQQGPPKPLGSPALLLPARTSVQVCPVSGTFSGFSSAPHLTSPAGLGWAGLADQLGPSMPSTKWWAPVVWGDCGGQRPPPPPEHDLDLWLGDQSAGGSPSPPGGRQGAWLWTGFGLRQRRGDRGGRLRGWRGWEVPRGRGCCQEERRGHWGH